MRRMAESGILLGRGDEQGRHSRTDQRERSRSADRIVEQPERALLAAAPSSALADTRSNASGSRGQFPGRHGEAGARDIAKIWLRVALAHQGRTVPLQAILER